MADVTGTVRHAHDGKTYALRLTPLGLAALQDDYGNDFLSDLQRVAETGGLPNMALFVDIVAQALFKGEGMDLGDARLLADDMVARDLSLPLRVVNAAFPAPEAATGNAGARRRP